MPKSESDKAWSGLSPLSSEIINCRGVGPKIASVLRNVGVSTVEHLLYYFPRTYLDRRNIHPIESIHPCQSAVIQGEITRVRSLRPSRRLHITQCVVRDETGAIKAVWFNQPYMARSLAKGTKVILSGGITEYHGLQMNNPDIEMLPGDERDFLHTLGLIPVYPLTKGMGQKLMRRILRTALDDFLEHIPENLPRENIRAEKLLSKKDALYGIHFPESRSEMEASRRRIAFEEFLALQLFIQSSTQNDADAGVAFNASARLTGRMEARLPFSLTFSQKSAIETIFRHMESPSQMNVLLQGDVGSGKTIVAAYSMLKAIENGRQAILMAPTEILAEQHRSSLRALFEWTRMESALLSGSIPQDDRKRILRLLDSGKPALIIGTHALIEQKVQAPNAGLIIIDEQHRFGVNQRAALRAKGINADLIVMTATPIPRTLALALYGNFKTVIIDEYPPGRHPVETRCVQDKDRAEVYGFLKSEIEAGRQAYVVCPEISERPETEGPGRANTERVCKEYKRSFPELSLHILHGRIEPEQREDTLRQFRNNEIQILIATTIIEVGVDVPNATVIVIEDAGRFGLAQLHQFRGRVGRAQHKSYCFLFGEPTTPEATKRLEVMTSTNDGFEIAEHDLMLRGPGEFLGTAQSGIPPLRVAHLIRDAALLERARKAAIKILRADPSLKSSRNRPLRHLLGSKPKTVQI